MPTIRQVAKACGVSPMTVSFVLNNRPGQVSEDTRERVMRTVREMGYRPTAVRSAGRRLTNTVGIVPGLPMYNFVPNDYFDRVFRAVLQKADSMRQNVTLFTSSLLHADIHRSIRTYCDGRCDGLIVIAPNMDSKLVSALRERGTPYVLIGASPGDETIPSCDVDNVQGMYMVTEYLIGLGHRRIAFSGGADFVLCVHQRYAGFCKAMRDFKIPLDPSIAVVGIHIKHQVYQWLVDILGRPASQRPTAVVAWNDEIAELALQAARDLDLSVPEQLSITGFDDYQAIVANHPNLTTVRQPYELIGGGAVEILLGQIQGDASAPHQRLEPGELIIRGSAAPPARR